MKIAATVWTQIAIVFLLDAALLGTCAILLLVFWGRGQELPVSLIMSRVHIGMTPAEVERALGQSPGSLAKSIVSNGSAMAGEPDCSHYTMSITDSGIGAMVVPQSEISLYLDQDKRVTQAYVKMVYQCDDEYIPTQIARRQRTRANSANSPLR